MNPRSPVPFTADEIFAAHVHAFDVDGFARHWLNACRYSLAAKSTPAWMDLPTFCGCNASVIEARQVYFLHMILVDSDNGAAICLDGADLTGVHHAGPSNGADLDLAAK